MLSDLASQAILRPNALYPPFNDPRARLALTNIVDQQDEMNAGYGDPAFFQRCSSSFVCGTPNGTQAGMAIDLQWSDWATVVSRSAKQVPPAEGGWHIYVTGEPGVLAVSPNTNIFAYMPCDRSNLAGWPCDADVEALRAQYAAAGSAERPALLEQIQRRLAVVNPYRLLGQATQPVAYRDNVSGVLSSPVPVYWNIEKR